VKKQHNPEIGFALTGEDSNVVGILIKLFVSIARRVSDVMQIDIHTALPLYLILVLLK
jgi:hypothetical protein